MSWRHRPDTLNNAPTNMRIFLALGPSGIKACAILYHVNSAFQGIKLNLSYLRQIFRLFCCGGNMDLPRLLLKQPLHEHSHSHTQKNTMPPTFPVLPAILTDSATFVVVGSLRRVQCFVARSGHCAEYSCNSATVLPDCPIAHCMIPQRQLNCTTWGKCPNIYSHKLTWKQTGGFGQKHAPRPTLRNNCLPIL